MGIEKLVERTFKKLPCSKTQLIYKRYCATNNMEEETMDLLAFVKEILNSGEVLDGSRHLSPPRCRRCPRYLWRICASWK